MSKPDPVESLRTLAKQYRARVVQENLYDPRVATSELDWRTSDELPPPDRFRHRVKLTIDGRRFDLRANDRYVTIDTRAVRTSMAFAVNGPDHMMCFTRRVPTPLGSRKLPVYVSAVVASPPVSDYPKLLRCIENLELARQERLLVAQTGLTVYVRPGSVQRIADVLNRVALLIMQLPEAAQPDDEFQDLPEAFSELIPLMKSWAKSDDVERSEKLARASDARLKRLVDRVTPHFAAINGYLDRFPDAAPSESAATLGTLAECAMEADLLLARRRDRSAAARPPISR